jgi:hypothetical protein
MENAIKPKDDAKSANEDVGQNSPCVIDKQKQCKQKEKYGTWQRRQQSHIKEDQNKQEIPTWFYTGNTAHRANNKRNNITSVRRGKSDGDTRSLNGRRRRIGYRNGYTDARSI